MSFFDEARARAKRRKSAWNLLLLPAGLVPWSILTWLTLRWLGDLARHFHPTRTFTVLPDTLGGILIGLASPFVWIGPAMILGNYLVAMVPPARRALDAEGATVPRADFRSANRDLLMLSLFLTPASFLLGLLGAWI